MKRSIPAGPAALLLLLPLVAGCGNKVTAPGGGMTQQTADDLAIQTAANLVVIGGDLELAKNTSNLAPLMGTRTATTASTAWDTTIVWGSITYQATRTFYDALDKELPGYGPEAVRMRWTSRAFGAWEGPRDTASIGHEAILDVRGIEPVKDTLRFDGTCLDTLQNRFRSLDGLRTRYLFWTSTTVVNAVHVPKLSIPSGGWPVDGTVTWNVSVDRLRSNDRRDVEAHFEATVVVTFDGTAEPEIVVNGAFRYRWNALTGAVTRE